MLVDNNDTADALANAASSGPHTHIGIRLPHASAITHWMHITYTEHLSRRLHDSGPQLGDQIAALVHFVHVLMNEGADPGCRHDDQGVVVWKECATYDASEAAAIPNSYNVRT